jgi:hypothetical protein
MKVGDLVTCIDDSYCIYYQSKRFLVVEQNECSDKTKEFRLRRIPDGHKTGWIAEQALKKL